MAILSLSEILKLKKIVSQYGYVLHLHDACGGQSFTMEPACDNPSEEIYQEIEKFFSEQKMAVNFYDNEKLNFVAR